MNHSKTVLLSPEKFVISNLRCFWNQQFSYIVLYKIYIILPVFRKVKQNKKQSQNRNNKIKRVQAMPVTAEFI
jgi:hypothetical protein